MFNKVNLCILSALTSFPVESRKSKVAVASLTTRVFKPIAAASRAVASMHSFAVKPTKIISVQEWLFNFASRSVLVKALDFVLAITISFSEDDKFASHLVANGHHSRQVEIAGVLSIEDQNELVYFRQ